MDEKVEKAFDVANYIASLSNQRRVILEEFEQKTVYYINGGTFKITPELISFTNLMIHRGIVKDAAFIDANNFPVIVNDVNKFYDDVVNTYFNAVNEYATRFADIKNKRRVEDIVSL
jgi:hypothetical protein